MVFLLIFKRCVPRQNDGSGSGINSTIGQQPADVGRRVDIYRTIFCQQAEPLPPIGYFMAPISCCRSTKITQAGKNAKQKREKHASVCIFGDTACPFCRQPEEAPCPRRKSSPHPKEKEVRQVAVNPCGNPPAAGDVSHAFPPPYRPHDLPAGFLHRSHPE